MSKQYRKKPVIIEAMQWTDTEHNSRSELQKFVGECFVPSDLDGNNSCGIRTLEGIMKVSLNDYIIKGVKGEFYPCKPDIFKATYEEVK